MVHTFEISQQITLPQFGVLAEGFGLSQQQIRDMLFHPSRRRSVRVSLSRQIPGLSFLRIRRLRVDGTNFFYAVIRMEPQALLHGERTISLFQATIENMDALSSAFHTAMNNFIDDRHPNLVTLSAWNCQRIDYSMNLHFDSQAKKNLFMELSRQTSRFVRRSMRRLYAIPIRRQSTGEGNCSSHLIVYEKDRQVEDVYLDVPPCVRQRLLAESENIVRIEYQCMRRKVQALRIREGFDSRSIINYLNEDLGQGLLLRVYGESIGAGDFYKVSGIRRRLRAAPCRPSTKEKLIQFVRLIASTRPRSLSKALESFTEGTDIGSTHIQGSYATFQNRCKALRRLGIHPVPIPRDNRLDCLENPIRQLENL